MPSNFTLDGVVPWGRKFDEYVHMFALSDDDLAGHILGCGDGPASFNMEATQQGFHVTSVDPLYVFTPEQIQTRVDETYKVIMKGVYENLDSFRWTRFPTPEDLAETRLSAMADFLTDFPNGKHEGRYITAELPDLPFADSQFDLALCSHFLFLYSEHFSLAFHLESIRELCRVANEVRIFPLFDLKVRLSAYVEPVMKRLREEGYQVERVEVDYEFQQGANEMLRVTSDSH